MKILLMSHDSYLHGATRSLVDLADMLRGEGTETCVLIPRKGPATDLLAHRAIPFETIYYPQLVSYGSSDSLFNQIRKVLSAIRNFPSLVRKVKHIAPDIIYVNTLTNYWLLLLKRFTKAKVVFHIREFGLPDHQIHLPMGGAIMRMLKGLADRTIFNSQAVSTYMLRELSISGTVIYNGVLRREDFDRNLARRKATETRERVNIGIVGNISPGKGQLEVVESFVAVLQKFSNAHLYVIGGGKRESIEGFIRERGLNDAVTVTGFQSDVTEYYSSCDVVVVNSKMEAFGRVVVEAASFGIPVIARATGAMPEIVIDGKTGLLCNGSIEDLVAKMQRLVADKPLRELMGNQAWIRYKELYCLERHIEDIRSLFTEIASEKPLRAVLSHSQSR